jgi:XTP/dITP diphosphohydrolase
MSNLVPCISSTALPLAAGTKLVLATHNAGKVREFQTLLQPYGLSVLSAASLKLPEPAETGTMFAENALIKARAAADATGLPALADDSGLCVEALDGAPGLFSARWAVTDKNTTKNFDAAMLRIEDELKKRGAVLPAQRRAWFVAALALVIPNAQKHQEYIFEGRVYGEITYPPRGTLGFGYDPIFLPNDSAQTFGEMSEHEKHGIINGAGLSHRARAFIAFAQSCL